MGEESLARGVGKKTDTPEGRIERYIEFNSENAW